MAWPVSVVRLLDILHKFAFVPETDERVVIQSGSELMFMWYLFQYAEQVLGKELVFDDVSVAEEVLASEQYGWCHAHGFCLAVAEPVLKFRYDLAEFGRFVFSEPVSCFDELVFEAVDELAWVFNYDLSPDENMPLHGVSCSLAYVAFFAYMVLLMYRMGQALPCLILQNDAKRQNEREYLDILVMKFHGNCWLDRRVLLRFRHGCYYQGGWEGFKEYKRQCGLMQRFIPVSEKCKYIQENICVGDVFLYYTKEKMHKKRGMDDLVSCYPCVVDGFDASTIRLRVYSDLMLRKTKAMYLDSLKVVHPQAADVLTYDDYRAFPVLTQTLDLLSVGVCDCMKNESSFFIPLFDDAPRFAQYLRVGMDEPGCWSQVYLSTKDLVFALFEDRGVSYNRERFLERYFPDGEEPMYSIAQSMQLDEFELMFESLLVPEVDLEALRAANEEVSSTVSTGEDDSVEVSDEEASDFADLGDLESMSEQELTELADAFLRQKGGMHG